MELQKYRDKQAVFRPGTSPEHWAIVPTGSSHTYFGPEYELFLLYEGGPPSLEDSYALPPEEGSLPPSKGDSSLYLIENAAPSSAASESVYGSSLDLDTNVAFLPQNHTRENPADAKLKLGENSHHLSLTLSGDYTSTANMHDEAGPHHGLASSDTAGAPLALGRQHGTTRRLPPNIPKEVEIMLRLLAATTHLEMPRINELWKNRIQLSEALANDLRDWNKPSASPEIFGLSSVVTRQAQSGQEAITSNIVKLSLPVDTDLIGPDEWDEVAKKYGKALQSLHARQDLYPAFLLVFRHGSKVYGSTASLLSYEHAFKAIKSQTDSESDPDPIHLEALGNILLRKFEKWYGLVDLDEAIVCYRDCLNFTDERHPRFITRLESLCNALQLRTGVTLEMSDISRAELLLEQTKTLAMSLDEKGQSIYKSMAALIKIASWAVSKDPTRYHEVVDIFLDVSTNNSVNDKFLKSAIRYVHILMVESNPNALEHLTALQNLAAVFLKILDVVALDNPIRLTLWMEAALLHQWLYHQTKFVELGSQALRLYNALCRDLQAGPEIRIRSAYVSAEMHLMLHRDADSALEDLRQAYYLIPEAVSFGIGRPDELRILRRLWDIPAFVTSVALIANASPETSMRLLEQGRGMIWDRLLNQKASLSELAEKHSSLAHDFVELRDKVRSSNPIFRKRRCSVTDVNSQFHATKLQRLIKDIRAQDGFDDFLQLPRNNSDFQSIGSEGPVVAVNVSALRADALIITNRGVINISLPKVTLKVCDEKIAELETALTHMKLGQDRANSMLSPVLKWLWKAIAKPILDTLNFFPVAGELPRIWWITTGPLCVLPIHAAGDHVEAAKTGIACTVMDRVISSYTPTLRALQFARQRQTAISQRKEGDSYLRALLVHMSKTPNMVDLEQATQEADRVKLILTNQVTRGHIPITQLPEPHYKTVLEHLQVSTIAHFACHAVVDTEDPSKSHLRLRDWGTSPLEVATLMNLDLSDCQLVYLSACETAVNKNSKLREEGLHISGGFQMAGVPNTIATWWEIEDRHPVDVATSFYGGLINEGSIDLTACASSLHQAVRGLRNLRIEPIVWAAYVHYGA